MSLDLNLPSNVKTEKERDTLGGGALSTDVYKGIVTLAYLDKSANGATSVNIHFKTDSGQEVRQTVYISNRNGEFTYKDKNTGEAKPLPGYTQMNAFFEAVTGKGIGQQVMEEKTIKLYDFEEKKEMPKQRTIFMDAINQPLAIGIVHVQEEKATKESGYKNGTGEFRDINEFDKFFDPTSGLTNVEKQAGETTPAFLKAWKDKKGGKTVIRKAKVSGTGSGAKAGSPVGDSAPASGNATSLFE